MYVQEIQDMVKEVLSETNDEIRLDLLINILSYKPYQNKTVREILESELNAMKEFVEARKQDNKE